MNRKAERERVREIAAVFIKHGMKDGLKGVNNPSQIRSALEELGPTFIKIGQILSTRPDMLPENYINEFQKLQDNVKPEKYDDIKDILETELGGRIGDLFLSFDKVPIACASMAEVHMAKLKSGERVVIKIQRPKARETMFNDIAILRRLTRFLKFTPQVNVLNPTEIVEELWQSVKKELDFLNEAGNIQKFYHNNDNVKFIKVPRVYERYTTSNVLVMEYIDGCKIADVGRLKDEGYDMEEIGRKLADNYFKQIFQDGFFHADPHPGNILIAGNKIAYIDFGMMGTLSKGMQAKFNTFLYGVALRDVDAMTRAVLRIGIKKGTVDTKKLYSDIEQIYNEYAEASLYDLNLPQMIDDVFKACRRNSISMPRDITMLLKGIMTIEGVVTKIAPDINIMDIAVPYVKKQVLDKRDYRQETAEQLENLYMMSKAGVRLPSKLLELANGALAGKLKVQMEHTNLDKSINQLNRMANRIVFGFIVSALIIGSSLVINADAGPRLYGMSIFGFSGYIGAGILGFWLLISIIRSGKM